MAKLTKAQRRAYILRQLTEEYHPELLDIAHRSDGWVECPTDFTDAVIPELVLEGLMQAHENMARITATGRSALKEASE